MYKFDHEISSYKEELETHEAFISPSTIGAARPGGFIAGANAMKTFTFSLSPG